MTPRPADVATRRGDTDPFSSQKGRGHARGGLLACLLLAGITACGGGGGRSGTVAEEAAWTASLEGGGAALLVRPKTALRGSSTYAVVLTRGIGDAAGRPLRASAELQRVKGTSDAAGDGPVALFDGDPEADGNPYPDPRLVRADGTIHIPDRFALRGLPDVSALAAARDLARTTADEVGAIPGFSTTAPIRVALSAAVDLASVAPATLRLVRLDGAAAADPFERALAAASEQGIARDDVALAFSFSTQPIADDLLAVGAVLRDLSDAGAIALALDDPDRSDDLPIGLFRRGEPGFAHFVEREPRLGDTAEVAAVASALLPSREFRGEDGLFAAELLRGEETTEVVDLHVLITIPAGGGPHPVVVAQHGFAGDNGVVLDFGARLAPRGLAAIGITAASHGRRGSPLDLLRASAVEVRDIFRQSIADQTALLRAIEAGIDLDGDGAPELDADRVGYLGVSLGGILGATLIALEGIVQAAVLNVAGGRVAFLGDAPGTRAIYAGSFANRVGLDVGSAEFETFLLRMLELGQQAFDSVDGLNYARHWIREPFPGVEPRRVLLQEGIGDLLVANESTEALAAAAGLIADTPMSDPSGVSGLWRFDPPGGHSIIARDDVFEQAAQFLASGGTEIIDP